MADPELYNCRRLHITLLLPCIVTLVSLSACADAVVFSLRETSTNFDHPPASQPTDRLIVTSLPDGSIILTPNTSIDRGIKWTIYPRWARAVGTAIETGQLSELAWQSPPDYWSADGGYAPLGISIAPLLTPVSKSITPLRCGARYTTASAVPLFIDQDAGADPFKAVGDRFIAGQEAHTMVERGEYGLARARPAHDLTSPWVFSVELTLPESTNPLTEITSFVVSYSYAPMPEGSSAPRAERTFGKSWDATWGKMQIKLGEQVDTGIYDSRNMEFPGTFNGGMTGNVIDGQWRDVAGRGTIHLALSEDGRRLIGTHTVEMLGQPSSPQIGPSGLEVTGIGAAISSAAQQIMANQSTISAAPLAPAAVSNRKYIALVALIGFVLTILLFAVFIGSLGRRRKRSNRPTQIRQPYPVIAQQKRPGVAPRRRG